LANLNKFKRVVVACLTPLSLYAGAQSMPPSSPSAGTSQFQPVPELPYRVLANFFKFPKGMVAGEAAGVAINSKGHIFLFQRTRPMLAEYDEKGNFIQSIGDGLFAHPHGLRIDADDNLWTTDDGNHLVLKLDSSGNVLLVLAGSTALAKRTGCSIGQPIWLSGGTAIFTSPMAMAILAS
jgi:hypothetical protein